ncbi:Crp/Fnr family transcriptional regulator [Robiginitomaculum antarcticum]|uniref:Crp/Fnr family transcriptional regulator n=1 Tax=Robiginitomaculum antarcticum TaxID=437507 RepID=UPI0014613DAE|nr:Crp/Fnr family transcriptional regulator [Robiginitomaculum antarcticum]
MTDEFKTFDRAIKNCAIIRDNIVLSEFSAGQTILIESESTAQVYFILHGKVKVTSFHPNGKEVWHAALNQGHTFGEMAAISGLPRSATIVTLEESKIGILSKSHFLNALESDSGVALFFLKDMVSRLQKATLYSNERVALEIPGRICAELLRQASPHQFGNGLLAVNSDLTVTTLAQQLNTSRETVSRTMSSLTEAGCIKKAGRRFFITNKAALIKRAEG